MKFENYLTELFKSDIPLTKKKSGQDFYVNFKVDDLVYFFEAAKIGPSYYDLGFWVEEGDVSLGKSITGRFNAPRVFAGVIKAFSLFIKERKPKKFQFASTEIEANRIRLYQKFADWIVKNFPYTAEHDGEGGWEFERK